MKANFLTIRCERQRVYAWVIKKKHFHLVFELFHELSVDVIGDNLNNLLLLSCFFFLFSIALNRDLLNHLNKVLIAAIMSG